MAAPTSQVPLAPLETSPGCKSYVSAIAAASLIQATTATPFLALEAVVRGPALLWATYDRAGSDGDGRIPTCCWLSVSRIVSRSGSFVAVGCASEAHFDIQPSVRARVDVEGCIVGGGDGGDDRETQAESVVVAHPVWGQALERLEEPIDLVGGYGRPRVGDLECGLAGLGLNS
jgi:hypothetical protein